MRRFIEFVRQHTGGQIFTGLVIAVISALLGAYLGPIISNWINAPKLVASMQAVTRTGPTEEASVVLVDNSIRDLLRQPILGPTWDQQVQLRSLSVKSLKEAISELRTYIDEAESYPKEYALTPKTTDDLMLFYENHRRFITQTLLFVANAGDEANKSKAKPLLSADRRPLRPSSWLFNIFQEELFVVGETTKATARPIGTNCTERPTDHLTREMLQLASQHQPAMLKVAEKAYRALEDAQREAASEPDAAFSFTLAVTNAGSQPTSITPLALLQYEQGGGKLSDPVFMRLVETDQRESDGKLGSNDTNGFDKRTLGPILLTGGQSVTITFSADTKTLADLLGKPSPQDTDYDRKVKTVEGKQLQNLKNLSEVYEGGTQNCWVTLIRSDGESATVDGRFGHQVAMERMFDAGKKARAKK